MQTVSTMSKEQREIRKLRFQLREMNDKMARRDSNMKRSFEVYEDQLEQAANREENYMHRLAELETGLQYDHVIARGDWDDNTTTSSRLYGGISSNQRRSSYGGNCRRNHYM